MKGAINTMDIRKLTREQRSERAVSHTKHMVDTYADEIRKCIANTTLIVRDKDNDMLISNDIIGDDNQVTSSNSGDTFVTDKDTVSELFDVDKNKKVTLLNFASYKNPGGKFLDGSPAQEESLCHHSYLYNVLSYYQKTYYDRHLKSLNHGAYSDEMLYSNNVRFFKYDDSGRELDTRFANVITCAAPNHSSLKYISDEYLKRNRRDELNVAMYKRIQFILDVLAKDDSDVVILGAFGCGVFQNDPATVAAMFKVELANRFDAHEFNKEVRFAIPHIGADNNFEIFFLHL